jgi:23S rRNA (uracil1939-C5)-methyltransferase
METRTKRPPGHASKAPYTTTAHAPKKRMFVNRSGLAEKVDRDGICRFGEECGSCPLLNEPYNQQLGSKTEDLRKLTDEAGMANVIVRDCVPSPDTLGYRRTVKLAVDSTKDMSDRVRVSIGLYKPATHRVVDVGRCPIHSDRINELLAFLRGEIWRDDITTYNERSRQGLLRHVIIRNAFATNQILLTLVVTENHPKLKPFARKLCEKFSYLNGVTLHVNNKVGNAIFSTDVDPDTDSGANILLAGIDTLNERLCDLKIRYSATSFMQVNPPVAEKIYYRIADLAQIRASETVVDVYCGVGSIGLSLARCAQKVVGIEETQSSIVDAKFNAEQNGFANTEFHEGRAEDILPRLVEQKHIAKADVVTLNPSRRGCQPQVMDAVAALKPRTIIYMSCSARSLLRDLKHFEKLGYRSLSLEPFDMFPRTPHYEVLAHLVPVASP